MCGTLAFSAIRNHDKVGLVCFTDRIEKVVPARKGPQHVLRVIRELLYHRPEGRGTNLAVPLEHLNRAVKRKSVVFLASDFQGGGYEQPMRVARRRHDLIPVVVEDGRERELPNVGLIELKDSETGRMVMVDTSSRRLRERYASQATQAAEQRDRLFHRMNVEAVSVRTGESFVEPLTRFFRAREARR